MDTASFNGGNFEGNIIKGKIYLAACFTPGHLFKRK